MKYEEMVARAQQMRLKDLYGAVTEEEKSIFPATQTKFQLPYGINRTVPVYRIVPSRLPMNCAMIINFHGGGFIKGRQPKDQLFCSRLAQTFHCLVWDVDYSLAPENPYPTAAEESFAVVSYAFEHAQELGVDVNRILLIGHSAGGNLATTVCMKASETNSFKPAGLIIEFCPLDLYTDPATKERVAGDMPAEVAKTYNSFYFAGTSTKDSYQSPIFATQEQLSRFPNTLIISAGLDSLCYEDEEFAMKLSRAGVTVTSRRFLNSRHGFTINRSDEWEEATKLLMDFSTSIIL